MLLGSLVHNQLLEGISLRIALRFVEEAMRSPPGNKLLRFAELALSEFRSDVAAWPEFCAQMIKVTLSVVLSAPGCAPSQLHGAARRCALCVTQAAL